MALGNGVREWTTSEFKEKESALNQAPSSLVSVVKSQIGGGYEVVEYPSENLEIEFAYHVDAMNHLLALLNFPDKLRGYLNCLLGLAKQAGGEVFEATNWQVGLRSRTGRASCTDDSMEKWVSRKNKALEEWMQFNGFQFIKRIPGTWNPLTEKNDPTRYQVFFNKYVVDTVAEAKTIHYWNSKQNTDRFRGRALREAARRILHRIPDAPPLKTARVKILSEEEKFDRRHRSVISFLEKNRDALGRLGIDWREYFIFLIREMDKICENPVGIAGTILTLPQNEPIRHESIWRKIKTGTLLLDEEAEKTALEEMASRAFAESFENVTSGDFADDSASDNLSDFLPEFENSSEMFNTDDFANSLISKNDDEGTFLSGRGDKIDSVKQDGGTNSSPRDEDMEVKEFQKIVEEWSFAVNNKMPPATPEKKISGVFEIDWKASDEDAQRTQDVLDFTILKTARDRSSLPELREKFADWIMARLRWWTGGVSGLAAGEETEKFRERLLKFLKLPEIE